MAKDKKTDTLNKGHKHLFGSTEKSDFILNMDFDGAQKMCSRFCMLAVLIISLVLIPAYYTQHIEMYVEENMPHYLGDNFIFYSASMVMLMGGLGYLVFDVARQKGLVDLKNNKTLILPILLLVSTLVSALAAGSKHDSLLGYIGRHDGFLMTLGWLGLFAATAALSDGKRKKALSDLIVGMGTFQAIVGIIEAIPAVSSVTSNYFENLFLYPSTTDVADASKGEIFISQEENYTSFGVYLKGRIASGFLTSPHALAAFLSVAFALAIGGAAFDDNKKRRILYCIAAPIMAAAACLTDVYAGVLGIGAASFIVLVLAVIKAAKGGKGALAVFIPLAVSGIAAGALFGTGTAEFNDEKVIFTDSYVVRSIGHYERYDYIYGMADKETDTRGIYDYLFGDAVNVISDRPALGVGPDNGIYHLSQYNLTMDRSYNEYMDTAMQKGVLTLILYAVFLVATLIKGIKLAAGFIKGKTDWVSAAAFAAVLAYMAQAWFNTTWFSATYIMFIAAGLCWDISVKGKNCKV